MILKLNHLNQKATASTQALIEAVYAMVAEGQLEKGQFARWQFELDWIQYKQNFMWCIWNYFLNDAFNFA